MRTGRPLPRHQQIPYGAQDGARVARSSRGGTAGAQSHAQGVLQRQHGEHVEEPPLEAAEHRGICLESSSYPPALPVLWILTHRRPRSTRTLGACPSIHKHNENRHIFAPVRSTACHKEPVAEIF